MEGFGERMYSYRDDVEPIVTTDFPLSVDEDILEPLDEVASFPDAQGKICEMHTYEARFNSKGERMYLQTGRKVEFEPESSRSDSVAMVLVREFDSKKALQGTVLEIRSPHVKAALKSIIKSYPGINFDTSTFVTLRDEPQCLFHYRKELLAHAKAMKQNHLEARNHVIFCVKYALYALRKGCRAYKSTMTGSGTALGLEFEHLWMAFKPGDYIYSKDVHTETASRLVSIERSHHEGGAWRLLLERIEYDGQYFGHVRRAVNIFPYEGFKPLIHLRYFPVRFHPEKVRIMEQLVQRGKLYVSLHGCHYKQYQGVVEFLERRDRFRHSGHYYDLDEEENETVGHNNNKDPQEIKERVIIDSQEFYEDGGPDFTSASKIWHTADDEHLKLENPDYLICRHEIPGYSLSRKLWAFFDISRLEDIDYNVRAFESLVLSPEKKRLILSIIQLREKSTLHFDDLIRGKGRGIVFLLHGPPGVGKTFTAESIAEYTKRPLWTVSCSDLGHTPIVCEQKLTSSLKLAKKWNAVVLSLQAIHIVKSGSITDFDHIVVDEADVFMAEREMKDLDRNELVSVLLRIVEYFEGVLFLTTNRVNVIDSAFKSRIHLSIAYPDLPQSSRRQLWESFIVRAAGQVRPEWLSDEFLAGIAATEINGREIKNAVRVAHALAAHAERDLAADDVQTVVRVMKAFDVDMQTQMAKRSAGPSEDDGLEGTSNKRKRTN